VRPVPLEMTRQPLGVIHRPVTSARCQVSTY
jgi:hypothetical protein